MILRLSQKLNTKIKVGKLAEMPLNENLGDDIAPSDIGYRLNETPMSGLEGPNGRKYDYPKNAFLNLVDRMGNE